jgi:ParB family transcriptional regulator, chromosome partitioning protein
MSVKKPALGRGLGALLGEATARQVAASAAAAAARTTAPGDELVRLPLDLLQRGKFQPRLDMRPESLADLAASIKSQGIVQPIVVRPIGTPAPGASQRYEIVAGERRWRAAQQAGITEIPAIVRRVRDEAAVAMALIENIQREDLNPLEEARALERLVAEFNLTHQAAADAVGRSRVTVTNLLRLLELADEVKTLVAERSLEMGHARALLALSNRRQQVEVATLVAKNELSVRATEALVRKHLHPTNGGGGAPAPVDANVRRLETELGDKLGAKVTFKQQAGGRGQLIISYSSLDELDGILAHIR